MRLTSPKGAAGASNCKWALRPKNAVILVPVTSTAAAAAWGSARTTPEALAHPWFHGFRPAFPLAPPFVGQTRQIKATFLTSKKTLPKSGKSALSRTRLRRAWKAKGSTTPAVGGRCHTSHAFLFVRCRFFRLPHALSSPACDSRSPSSGLVRSARYHDGSKFVSVELAILFSSFKRFLTFFPLRYLLRHGLGS